MVLGLVFAVVLARGSMPKAIAMILVGILFPPSAPTSKPARSA